MFDAFCKNTLVPLILRLGLAAIFIFHGLDKVNADMQWGSDWDPSHSLPATQQLAVAWGELLGGVALALGFLTRLAALGISAIMVGAIVTIHWEHGFSLRDGGFEYNFAIIVMCLAVVLMGGGALAVDRIFRLRARR